MGRQVGQWLQSPVMADFVGAWGQNAAVTTQPCALVGDCIPTVTMGP